MTCVCQWSCLSDTPVTSHRIQALCGLTSFTWSYVSAWETSRAWWISKGCNGQFVRSVTLYRLLTSVVVVANRYHTIIHLIYLQCDKGCGLCCLLKHITLLVWQRLMRLTMHVFANMRANTYNGSLSTVMAIMST